MNYNLTRTNPDNTIYNDFPEFLSAHKVVDILKSELVTQAYCDWTVWYGNDSLIFSNKTQGSGLLSWEQIRRNIENMRIE